MTPTLCINTFKQEPGGTKAYELQFSSDEKAVVNDHCCHTATRFIVSIKEDQERLPTLYWLPKFIRFTTSAFRKLLSIYVFSYFPFGFEGRMWDLIVSVPDHCLSFYFSQKTIYITFVLALLLNFQKY